MRSGFAAFCGFIAFVCALRAQGTVAPSIVTQPMSLQVAVAETATLSATADGTAPLSYQWRKNGTAVTGATNSTLVFAAAALTDAGIYDLVVTNGAGSATSVAAALSVVKKTQTISFNSPSGFIAAGSSITLTATASSGLPVAFALVSGAATLSGNVLTGSGGNVVVRAMQSGNAATFEAATPVEGTFLFVAGALTPFVTTPLADQTVVAGASATFRTTAIGTPTPTYQWRKDGAILEGATDSTFTVANATLASAGRYTVTATNPVGNSSSTATLVVRAAPVLTMVPQATTAFAGDGITLTADASGFPAPTFQWRRNGVALTGATAATLTIATATTADAGRYDVVATNALGSATSPAIPLTITTRDFTGTYFGRFSGGGAPAGAFALQVRPNRVATLLGHDPAIPAGLLVLDLPIDPAGRFSRSVVSGTGTLTARGTLNETTGEITGEVPELRLAFSGTRAGPAAPPTGQAGLYHFFIPGTAAFRGFLILANDSTSYALLTNGTAAEGAMGTAGAGGRLTFTTESRNVIEAVSVDGLLAGTVRTAAGEMAALSGTLETLLGTERLINLSARATVVAASPLITGFVVTGAAPKRVLVRAVGPTLGQAPFNIPGALADPALQVLRGNVVVAQNDEWGNPPANGALVTTVATATGAFPLRAGSTDAALVSSLQAGAYTAVIDGGNGTALAEIYEALENNEAAGSRRLVNLSARGLVAPGSPLIAGFVVGGRGPQRVLIRAIGPTLAPPPFNVAGALANPQLTLLRGTTPIKTNDDWFRDADATLIRDAAVRAGAFPLGAQSVDAATLLYLTPGAYTVQVTSTTAQPNAVGIALVEIYDAAP